MTTPTRVRSEMASATPRTASVIVQFTLSNTTCVSSPPLPVAVLQLHDVGGVAGSVEQEVVGQEVESSFGSAVS